MFIADGLPGLNLVPDAWRSAGSRRFPAQIRVTMTTTHLTARVTESRLQGGFCDAERTARFVALLRGSLPQASVHSASSNKRRRSDSDFEDEEEEEDHTQVTIILDR